jgi:hypothetical protein
MQFVVSLTTIPDRVAFLDITIASILQQSRVPDAIYVCLPYYSKRFQKAYPIPTFEDARVHVIRCQDYGPATKILGLLADCPTTITDDTRIVFCDDDRIYDHTHFETLLVAADEHPQTVICLATSPHWKYFITPATTYEYNSDLLFPAGRHKYSDGYMDIFEGFGGVVVSKAMFTSSVFEIPPEIAFVDDIWLSGHVKTQKFPIWGVASLQIPACHSGNDVSPLYALGGNQERRLLNQKAIEWYQVRHQIWKDITPRIESSCSIPVFDALAFKFNQCPGRPIEVPRDSLTGTELLGFLASHDEWSQTLTKRATEMLQEVSRLTHQLTSVRQLQEYSTKDIEGTLLRKIETKRTAFQGLLQEYSEYIRQQSTSLRLKHRVLCQMCKCDFMDGVYIPCGHGVCYGCKTTNCKLCKKVVTFQALTIG